MIENPLRRCTYWGEGPEGLGWYTIERPDGWSAREWLTESSVITVLALWDAFVLWCEGWYRF